MTTKLEGGGPGVCGCSAISHIVIRPGFWAKLLAVAAIAALQIVTATPAAAQAQTKVNPKDGMTYVYVPPGTFQMGCSQNDNGCAADEKPAHDDFRLFGLARRR